MAKRSWFLLPFVLLFQLVRVQAGVVNPDISAIGQVFETYTDDPASEAAKKFSLTLGETEIVLGAALNPYFKGLFVATLGDEGAEIEEAYASLIRGLPLNLALKAGKYRLNFGKLNAFHPHSYPFLRTPRVLNPEIAELLPGEESFNDVAAQASTLIPVIGSWAATVSADILQGGIFHPDTTAVSNGWLAHVSNTFFMGSTAFDIGASLTQGTNDLIAETKTTVIGLDAKAKVAFSPLWNVTLNGEYLRNVAKQADSLGEITSEARYGFYTYADARFRTRYNAGILYERYRNPIQQSDFDWALKPFVGFGVLEESTILRLSYEYFVPADAPAVNTVELQLLFSMGPHKPHQF